MGRIQTVDEYIKAKSAWQIELATLRAIMQDAGMEEGIKWGAPVYMVHGKNVVGLAAFKHYVAIWFFQGGLLTDAAGKLINAQEGKTKALRQWRFTSLEEIQKNHDLINAYVKEAMENARAGKAMKPQRKKELVMPSELKDQLENDPAVARAFAELSPGRQREYAEYIAEAKRPETRTKRLQKILPMIREGKGLFDKYKKR